MELVSAKCTSCGGEIQIDKDREMGFCMHCGSKVIIQEAISNIRIDQSHMLENYQTLLNSAYEGENFVQVEEYCNKILEINPKDHNTWFIKGQAINKQSTISNNRFSETISCWGNYMNLVKANSANNVEEVKQKIDTEGVNVLSSHLSIILTKFINYPNKDTSNTLIKNMDIFEKSFNKLNTQTSEEIFNVNQIMNQVILPTYEIILELYNNKIIKNYHGRENKPSDNDFLNYISQTYACTSILDKLLRIGYSEEQQKVNIYESLIKIYEQLKNACSWNYSYVKGIKIWFKKQTLTDEAKNNIDKLISNYENNKNELKGKIQENKIKQKEAERQKYWEEHPDEYEVFLRAKPLEDQIKNLNDERSNLGIFARKEKKDIDEKINKLQNLINSIRMK